MRISKISATTPSLLVAILFTAILSVAVVAQSENGSISGTVKDSAGAAVSGAQHFAIATSSKFGL